MYFLDLLCYGLIGLGLVTALAGFAVMCVFRKGNRTGEDTEATVVSILRSSFHMRSSLSPFRVYRVTVQYQFGGQTYTDSVWTTSFDHKPEAGKVYTVGVDPQNPGKAYLRRNGALYIAAYVLAAAILAMGVLSLVL